MCQTVITNNQDNWGKLALSSGDGGLNKMFKFKSYVAPREMANHTNDLGTRNSDIVNLKTKNSDIVNHTNDLGTKDSDIVNLKIKNSDIVNLRKNVKCVQGESESLYEEKDLRSARNKTNIINEYINHNNLDIMIIVEAWLDANKHKREIGELKGNNFELKLTPRAERIGGGLAILHKKNIQVKKCKPPECKTFEIMEILVTTTNKKLRIVTIYRPDSSLSHRYTLTEFFDEFNEVLGHYLCMKDEILFCGDYNIHVNKPNDYKARRLQSILDTFDLKQHVKEPTHEHGNTLDLILTKNDTSLISHSVDEMISDHCSILMNLDMKKPPPIRKMLTFRKTKNINLKDFKKDVDSAMEGIDLNSDLADLVDAYNTQLGTVLNKHAPEQTKMITIRKPTPWTTDEIRPDKRECRRLKRKYKNTKLDIDLQLLKEQKLKYKKLLDDKRNEHYTDLLEKNKDDPKSLFKVINSALNKKEDNPYPVASSDRELANDFNDFFDGKISKIRNNLDIANIQANTKKPNETRQFTTFLNEFRALSEEEVRRLMMNSKNKHCELDPVPTWLLKECIDSVLPLVTKIINLSLELGDMPRDLKLAIIKPLLKKLDLELEKKNYRPVSNLAFISKLIEKAVAFQFIEHLKINNLYDDFQSAYRQFHSTETTLLRVKNDVLNELDDQKVVMLLLLDLSAAFDTIDHDILLNRLSERCGIQGMALKWMKSYLSNRYQKVKINDSYSELKEVKYGVPQGSVLGPILFTIYMSPLGKIIENCGLKRQTFADDNGLYLSISPIDKDAQEETVLKVSKCIEKVKEFMLVNRLKINDDKTVFMLLGSKYWINKLNLTKFKMGDTEICPVDETKNLGIIFDREMTMQKHVNYICKKGFYHIRDLFALRKILDEKKTNTAAHAFVTSILDYGNSLLYGMSAYLVEKMQKVQNAAVRAVRKVKKNDHITEHREGIHWLPIEARIKFKYILITWKCIHNMAPKYLQDLLNIKSGWRTNYRKLLCVPKSNHRTHGDISFKVAAPELWNALPPEIRTIDKLETFKGKLKTHLFNVYKNKAALNTLYKKKWKL